jgi:AcrR family transcriptional regulator
VGLLPGEVERPAQPPARSPRVAEIVEAARRILEDEGAGALTMRRLAEELHIQAPSLYKHFSGKADVESVLIEDALFAIGDVTHAVLHATGPETGLRRLLDVYHSHCLSHANLYRLATSGHLDRERLPEGLEEWAGNPWFVVTGEPALAQALWSFAHGMLILELDQRYPPGSDLRRTWRAGAAAFELATVPARVGA